MEITLDTPQLGGTGAPMCAKSAEVPHPRQEVHARPVQQIRDDEQEHELGGRANPEPIDNATAEHGGDIGEGQDAEAHGRRNGGDRHPHLAREMDASRRLSRSYRQSVCGHTGPRMATRANASRRHGVELQATRVPDHGRREGAATRRYFEARGSAIRRAARERYSFPRALFSSE